jgi:hypothetical protein
MLQSLEENDDWKLEILGLRCEEVDLGKVSLLLSLPFHGLVREKREENGEERGGYANN